MPSATAAITAIRDNAGLIQGRVAAGGRSDDRTPTLSGSLSAALATGETLRIFNGKTLLGTAKVNNRSRTWTYTPVALPRTAGTTHAFRARIADAAVTADGVVAPSESRKESDKYERLDVLVEQLKLYRKEREALKKEAIVVIDGDKDAKYQRIIQVWNAARNAGIRQVSFQVEPGKPEETKAR